jgi:Cyclin, C-terminal domain/Cyclin, N-terminal domain
MYYMDRMLAQCAQENGPRNQEFLLLAVSSFYLAIKLACKPSHVVFPIHAMIHIAKNQFSVQQIADAEFRILEGLGWRVHPPTADQFVYALIDICCCHRDEHRCQQIKDYAIYLIELSVLDCFFVQFKPSEVALAALYCAQDVVVDMAISADLCTNLGNATAPIYLHLQGASIPSFELDPAQVLQYVLEPTRVAACRSRFALVLEHRCADVATAFAECHHQTHLGQSRTGSPVSVHPQDSGSTAGTTTFQIGGTSSSFLGGNDSTIRTTGGTD